MVAVLIALAASATWGVSDFFGGFFSRRWPALSVLLVVEAAGLLAAATIVVLSGDAFPDTRHALMAVAAGLAGGTGLALFYTGLAIGTMSIVAPISATGAVVPVVVGLATGDELTALIGAGLAFALVGVVLAGREDEDGGGATRGVVLLALGSALGFGTFFTCIDVAADASTGWALLLGRLPPIPIVALLVRRQGLAMPSGTDLKRLLAVAQLDCIATALYALAITRGALSIVAVVGSLYPVTTVLLARVLVGERLRAVQATGVVLAFAGVALVSLGSA